MKIKKVLFGAFVFANLVLAISFMVYTLILTRGNEIFDFQVFYGAAGMFWRGVRSIQIMGRLIYHSGISLGFLDISSLAFFPLSWPL